jgi:hypothetical protein
LQSNSRWKALHEIYQIDSPVHPSTLKISANFVKRFAQIANTSKEIRKMLLFEKDFHRAFRKFS